MKTDRRTIYSKMVIKESLLSLMKEKPFQKITVSDICEGAEISRPTFYLHYEDIYALLDEIGEEMLTSAKLDEMMQLTMKDQDAIYASILNLLKIIQDNLDVYRICVLERGVSSRFPAKISNTIKDNVIKKWEQDGSLKAQTDIDYMTTYIQASFNSIVYHWICKKEEKESEEELAKLIECFLVKGLSGFVSK